MKKTIAQKKDIGARIADILEYHIELAKSLIQRLDIVEAQNKELYKILGSQQEMLIEHQRVLRILFNESPDKKPN
jgi:hypothetical protein